MMRRGRRRFPCLAFESKGIRFRIRLLWMQFALKRGSSSARIPIPDPAVMGDEPVERSC